MSGHSENLLEAHPLIIAPSVVLLDGLADICPVVPRYSKPRQFAVTPPMDTHLKEMSFQLILELFELLIWAHLWIFPFFFFSFLTYMWLQENSVGKVTSRKKDEVTMSCFLLTRGHCSFCSASPTNLGYFPVPLDDFQRFQLWEHLQSGMSSDTLVVSGKCLLALLSFPGDFPDTGSGQSF